MNNEKRQHRCLFVAQRVQEGDEHNKTPMTVSRRAPTVQKDDEQRKTPMGGLFRCSLCVRWWRARQDTHRGCLVLLRGRTTTANEHEHVCSFSWVMGDSGGPGEQPPRKRANVCSFSRVVETGGAGEEPPMKTSTYAHFRGWWGTVGLDNNHRH